MVLAGAATGSTFIEPVFRALAIKDTVIPTVTIAASAIDWSLGNVFSKGLAANITFTFTNTTDGQTIRVRILQDASHTVHWPATVMWPGGIEPTMTVGGGRFDIFTFINIAGIIYGTAVQDMH